MKASTLFAITIAVLLGLGVVAVAKYAGLFAPRAQPPAPAKEAPKVLVAARNLFEGLTITSNDVRVRDMRPEEEEIWKTHKDKYLPPLIEAGALRVLARNVDADTPIMKEHLQDSGLPDPLNRRLSSPMMRAVNVSLPPEQVAGGLIQIHERVDVFLTSRISVGTKQDNSVTQTAPIARNLRVIAKRNLLWTAMVANPPNKPIDYTLEANPYRAALIEFSKSRGDLTLVPTAAPQEPTVQSSRAVVSPTQSDPTSKEYAEEDKRIAEFLNGERIIGEADLVRIFGLKPIQPPQLVQVERYTGVEYRGVQTFGQTGNGQMRPVTSEPSYNYQFTPLPRRKRGDTGEMDQGNRIGG
jgi:Flp pilus assembly protein CpaB